MPLPEPIITTAVLLLCHVPVPNASVNVAVTPGHIAALAPPIAGVAGLTVTIVVVEQPDNTL
jgi:hypothetical protein